MGYQGAYTGKQIDERLGKIPGLESGFASVKNDIAALLSAVGTPLVASTVAGMTDKTKIYVYTGSETGYTAGNWYYWDSSLTTPAWTSGGVYNSIAVETDTTLTVSGAAADAKATGDRLEQVFVVKRKLTGEDNVDEILESGIYAVTASGADWKPDNWPLAGGGTFIVYRWPTTSTSSPILRTIHVIYTHEEIVFRAGSGTGYQWNDWVHVSDTTELESALKDYIDAADDTINATVQGNYAYDSTKTYKFGDYAAHDGAIYQAATDIDTPEEWTSYKWRTVSSLSELSKANGVADILGAYGVDVEKDYRTFPILFELGRGESDGSLKPEEETVDIVKRRMRSNLIPADAIDGVLIDTGVYNSTIYFGRFNAEKELIGSTYNISGGNISNLPVKIIATPKTCDYVRISLVAVPDTTGNDYDAAEVIKSKHVIGIKYLGNERCNSSTFETEVGLPVAVGNVLQTAEDYSQTNKRARTPFLKTEDFQMITNIGTENNYTTVVRYYNTQNATAESAHESFATSDGSDRRIVINHDYTFFRLQIMDESAPSSTIINLNDLRKFRLVKSRAYDDIITLNDEKETRVKLQQISTNYRAKETLLAQPLTLLHFSDLHAKTEALKRIIRYRDYYQEYIRDTIHTGDNVGSISTAHIFGNISGAENILNVVGNHDTRKSGATTYADWHYLGEEDTWDRYFDPFVQNWGDVSTEEGKCYYYKDYGLDPNEESTAKHVRLIVIDCMHETNDQLSWFASALEGARTAGLHVIVASHVKMAASESLTYLTSSGFQNPACPTTSPTTDGQFPSHSDAGFASAVDSFVANGGTIACWLCGHMHVDMLATYHDVLNVAVTTAGDISTDRTRDARIKGTRSFDAFNIVGVDTVRQLVSIMRVGLNYNAGLKEIDTLCWDYNRHVLI